ncbi:MAG: phage major capsid protein [Aestuariivirga sp.]|uniref:phage major capsid protein n=1 Tax=Aestuariivirga sp. TaxID=2650926 RepID=UPI0025C67F15|nr:phage major capsid protein [Aestuariivirga sp.]MCA3562353.1 phage major capsid protein [Aestuariivirga sp.]
MTDTLERINTAFEQTKSHLEEMMERLATAERLAAQATKRADDIERKMGRAALTGTGGGTTYTREQLDHRDAFEQWLRRPGDYHKRARLMEAEAAVSGPDERRTSTTLTGADGGHLVPAPVMTDIVRRLTNLSPIRLIARAVEVSSTGTKFPLDRQGTGSGWIAENVTRTATAEPTLDLRTPSYGTCYALMAATEELMMDSAINITSWLTESAAVALAATEGAAFVAGNGTNRPTGFLSGPTPVTTADSSRASGTLQYVVGGAAAAISSVDGIVNLYWALKAGHRQNGNWVMNSATAAVVQLLKDTQGRSLWAPALSEAAPATLLGRPVVLAEDMQAIAANNFPIAFGNFNSGYLIADQGGLRITVDDNISTPGLVKFYIRRRVGGNILDSEAIKLLKVSTT